MYLILFVPLVSRCFRTIVQDRITRSRFVQLIGTWEVFFNTPDKGLQDSSRQPEIVRGRQYLQDAAEIVKHFKILVMCFSAMVLRNGGIFNINSKLQI
jgi:hypothetical protein